MTRNLKICSCFLLFILSDISYSDIYDPVRVSQSQSNEFDASHNYYIGLLELAFSKSMPPGKVKKIVYGKHMNSALKVEQLRKGKGIDIMWGGTSKKREQQLKAIKIPIFKGLLGFRVGLMHADMVEKFDAISNIHQALEFRPCQGANWPDSKILTAGGFNVIKNMDYQSMFKQTYNKDCDFFPRGINEAKSEYLASKGSYPDLYLHTDLIIYYPLPTYFFVHRDNAELAKLIHSGLEIAINDGDFDRYLQRNEITKHLFPVENWINVKYIELNNPLLPENTDTKNPRYWIQPPRKNVMKE